MPCDIASLERATLAAVPPQQQEETDGWLLGLDAGTVGRAHSAVPLQHATPDADAIAPIAARYQALQLTPVFRIPELPAFAAVKAELTQHGFRASKPTLTQTGSASALAALADGMAVTLATAPGAGWSAVFLGEGFDPVDGASRLAILRRAADSVFASVAVDGQVVAVGSACYAHGWAGIHGMRTAPAFRGRGLAAQILARLGAQAQSRGIERAFLQVEEPNLGAQSLYRRAGFTTAWAYAYWKR